MCCALLYIEYVRIHPIRSQSVFVVTRTHNDADHMTDCLGDGSLSMLAFPWPCLIAAVDMHISQTATTLAVVFELFSTKQEKLIEVRLHCMHINLVFSEAFKKPNPVFR